MAIPQIVQRYFDAWNRRDPEAVAASFSRGGTYRDPATDGPLSGIAIVRYAAERFQLFPDLSFEVIDAARTGVSSSVCRWMMRGTNTGPASGGGAPLGRVINLPGIDLILAGENGLRLVESYFDRRTLVEQMGLVTAVTPFLTPSG